VETVAHRIRGEKALRLLEKEERQAASRLRKRFVRTEGQRRSSPSSSPEFVLERRTKGGGGEKNFEEHLPKGRGEYVHNRDFLSQKGKKHPR